MKKTLAITLALAALAISVNFSVNSAEAARRPSLGKQIRRDVDRIYRNQVRNTARNRAYREIRKVLKYTDPDSREAREYRAKRALLGLPIGASIVQCSTEMRNIMVRLIRNDADLFLFGAKIVKTRDGKSVLIVNRYASAEEMLQ